jgi:hypothetical protein
MGQGIRTPAQIENFLEEAKLRAEKYRLDDPSHAPATHPFEEAESRKRLR